MITFSISRFQAIGRVIRHKLDYGAILLCDQRFSTPDLIRQLSSWVRSRVVTFPKIGPLLRDLGMFFRNADILFPGSAKAVRAPVPIDTNREETKKIHSTVDSFHHALSSSSSRIGSQNSKGGSISSREVDQMDLHSYSTLIKPKTNTETCSIFDRSEGTTKVIDFNETESIASTSKSDSKITESQPAIKKRKITIISDAAKANYDLRRLKPTANILDAQPEVQASSGSVLASIPSNAPPTVDQKKKDAAEYLKSVKSSLNPANYTVFSSMIKTYRDDRNYETLMSTLKKLFLQSSEFRHLLKGQFNSLLNICSLVN